MRATIKAKLGATFGLLIVILAAVVLVATMRLGTLNQAITDLINGPSKRLETAMSLDIEIGKLVKAEKNILLTEDKQLEQEFSASITQDQAGIDKMLDDAGGQAMPPETKALWTRASQDWATFKPINARVRDLGMAG